MQFHDVRLLKNGSESPLILSRPPPSNSRRPVGLGVCHGPGTSFRGYWNNTGDRAHPYLGKMRAKDCSSRFSMKWRPLTTQSIGPLSCWWLLVKRRNWETLHESTWCSGLSSFRTVDALQADADRFRAVLFVNEQDHGVVIASQVTRVFTPH
jgi:hypothetical protein